MDWSTIISGVLDGSPWALVVVFGFFAWKLKGEYVKVIEEKNSEITAKDAKIQELNSELKTTTKEMGDHVESVLTKAHEEALRIQSEGHAETRELQREVNDTLSRLDATLQGLIVAVRSDGRGGS